VAVRRETGIRYGIALQLLLLLLLLLTLHGDEPIAPVVIEESGVRMEVDIVAGHKTGFYLDQRDNRQLLRQFARGRGVLNCFCYTGGFSLQPPTIRCCSISRRGSI
jgi:hypothetical protein